jgi:hypothetical protein
MAQFTATGVYTDNSTQNLTAQVTWASSDGAVASVSNAAGSNGIATTIAVGSTMVSAASGDVAGETMLTVTDATLVSIEVSPAAPSVANGSTRQFAATGLYTDNSTQDLTTQVTWTSSDEAVAMVSNSAGSNGLATTAATGSTTVSATSGAVTGETTLTVSAATLVSIEVSPVNASISNGSTQQFTATGLYTDNSTQDVTAQVTWASSDGAVAPVSNAAGSNGLATTAGEGSTTVSASGGGVTGETTLTVTDATLVSIEVSPVNASISNGSTQQYTATGLYTDNSTQDVTAQVTWASSDHAVAMVSNATGTKGLAAAAALGSTTVSATSGDVTGEATLTVTAAALVSIEVSPAAPSIPNGSTQQFTATGVYTANSMEDVTAQVTWASSDGAVATVSNAAGSKGLATSAAAGSTTVSATTGDVTGETTLTVTAATLVSIEVLPAASSLPNGSTQQYTATGVYTDDSMEDVTTQVTWASSDSAVATVSNAAGSKGRATAATLGSTTVSATSGDVTGETTLTVTAATLMWIEVSPATPGIPNGSTQQFAATGFYTDNSTQDLTAQVTWVSSDGAVATVSNAAGSKGLATTAAVGATTVSATSGDVAGETTLTVNDAALMWIEVSPATPSIPGGATQQFTATGLYTDNSTQDLTAQVTWASSDGAVATVSNAAGAQGLATAAASGSTTISAISGDITGHATLTVTDPVLVSIDVSPLAPGIMNGSTQQFTATGLYTDDSTQDLTAQVIWASSDGAVATVSNSVGSIGLATATAVGSTTVSATSGDVTSEAILTVTPVVLTVDQMVAALLTAVTGVGPGHSLADKVTNVQDYLAVPDIASACSALDDFQLEVLAMSGKQVNATLAAQLAADAGTIKAAVPCP